MRIWAGLSLLIVIPAMGCTGSPQTLALRPAFEVMTPTGIASVSMRQSPPGMSDAEFTRLVPHGMASAMPGSLLNTPVVAPYPTHRIVWHAMPETRGVSRLLVNVFDGSNSFACKEQVVDNSAPHAVLEYTIVSLTRQLMAQIDRQSSRQTA